MATQTLLPCLHLTISPKRLWLGCSSSITQPRRPMGSQTSHMMWAMSLQPLVHVWRAYGVSPDRYVTISRKFAKDFANSWTRSSEWPLLQAPAAFAALPPLRLPLAMSLEGLEVAESTFLWSHTSDRYANTIRAIAKSMCERVASCQLILLHSPRQPDCMGMMADA